VRGEEDSYPKPNFDAILPKIRRAQMKTVVVCLLLVFTPLFSCAEEISLLIDDFESGLRPAWKEKVFEGHTGYLVVPEGAGHVLRAESHGAASGLILEKEIDLKEFPILSWRWKVENILAKGDARRKEGDDYAARVYVIFPHWFFLKTRSINYILFWFSVNWRIPPFELDCANGGIHHAKKAEKLHGSGEGFHSQALPG